MQSIDGCPADSRHGHFEHLHVRFSVEAGREIDRGCPARVDTSPCCSTVRCDREHHGVDRRRTKDGLLSTRSKLSPIFMVNNEVHRVLFVDMVSDEQDEPTQSTACVRRTEVIETHFDRTAAESEIMWDEVQSRSVGMHVPVSECHPFRFRQALTQGLFMNAAECYKENEYRTVEFIMKKAPVPELCRSDQRSTHCEDSSEFCSLRRETVAGRIHRTDPNDAAVYSVCASGWAWTSSSLCFLF